MAPPRRGGNQRNDDEPADDERHHDAQAAVADERRHAATLDQQPREKRACRGALDSVLHGNHIDVLAKPPSTDDVEELREREQPTIEQTDWPGAELPVPAADELEG